MGGLLEWAVQSDEVVGFLKKTLQYRVAKQSILTLKLTAQAAQAQDIGVNDDDVQAEAERQRRELRLEKASDTLTWLAEQQITPVEWEQGIRDQIGQDVERFFGEHRLDYDRVVLYQIIVPYQQVAQELFYQIAEAEISFYEAAHLYHVDEDARRRCGFEGVLQRWALQPNLAAAVFGVPIGQIARPIQTDQGYHLLRVEELIPASLTPEIRQEILDNKFQEWLRNELNYWLSSST
jgi:parvulin-like peptidyl-prolyl isomerase